VGVKIFPPWQSFLGEGVGEGQRSNLAHTRDGAILFGDLIGKLDDLRVSCDKCGCFGRYPVQRLINDRGRGGKIVNWLDQITADCPKKSALNWSDRCGAKCPDLPRVF